LSNFDFTLFNKLSNDLILFLSKETAKVFIGLINIFLIEGMFGRVLSVEVKTEIGKQSDAQIKMQNRIELLNGRYILVRSLLDFNLQIINHIDWLLGKE